MSAEESKGEEIRTKRPPEGAFYQQNLKAWQPILTPYWVIVIFSSIGILFIAMGIPLYIASQGVVEMSKQYDGEGTLPELTGCKLPANANQTSCSITFDIKEEMKCPVYVYYELENFYQNHRRYVKSRSDVQLRGDDLSEDSLSNCDPLISRDGKVLHPCGLIANSFFNDTFALSDHTMLETDIAWKSDRDDKFKNSEGFKANPRSTNTLWLDQLYPQFPHLSTQGVENEHFIVWMRTAALPNFRKLYGRIEQFQGKDTIPVGSSLRFNVTANFAVLPFEGKKALVLSTTSWLGGKNDFLGLAYLIVGGACLFLALLFGIKHSLSPRPLGDMAWVTKG